MKADNLIVGANSVGITDFSGLLASLSLKVRRQAPGDRRLPQGPTFSRHAARRVQVHNTSIGTLRVRGGHSSKSGEGVRSPIWCRSGRTANSEEQFITEMPAYPDLYKEVHGKLPWSGLGCVQLVHQPDRRDDLCRDRPARAPGSGRHRAPVTASNRPPADPDFIKGVGCEEWDSLQLTSASNRAGRSSALAEVSPQILSTLRDRWACGISCPSPRPRWARPLVRHPDARGSFPPAEHVDRHAAARYQ